MKKIGIIVLTLLMTLTLSINSVLAADVTYAKDGWNSVGENEVQLFTKELKIANAEAQNGVSVSGDFKLMHNKKYTDEEFTNGTYDRERTSNSIVSYHAMDDDRAVIVYSNPLAKGEHTFNDTVVLKWQNAARLDDGTLCDVTMTVNNFKIKNNRATTRPIATLYDTGSNVWAGSWYSTQEAAAADLTEGHQFKYNDIGVSYDITIKVTKHGTDETIQKNMAFGFRDIDVKDNTLGEESAIQSEYEVSGSAAPYAEGVELISGINDKLHLEADTLLKFSNTSNGANTRVYGSGGTTGIEQEKKSGFVTLVNSSNFKFRWYGSHCGTSLGGIDPSTVTTSTSGTYKDKIVITETDKEVLWRENKEVVMNPDDGFHVSKITIDGVEIPYDTLPLQNGKRTYTNNGKTYTFNEDYYDTVTYVFDGVISDHEIDVQVEKNNYIIHYDANGGKGTMEDTNAEYDVEGNLSKNEFTNEGYRFIGWKAYYEDENGKLVELKDEDGNVMTFKDEESFINLIGKNNGEVTLKAQWEKPLIVNVPKTGINTPLFITLMGISLIAFAIFIKRYVY